MRYITWVLLTVLFIFDTLCNDVLLSKFHQNSFKIKDVRIELISFNEEYFNFFQIKTFKFNRTTPATNGTFNMKIAVKDKMEVLLQAHKFLSNEYRHFPVRFQLNIKKCVNLNAMGLGTVKNCGNLTTFIIEKDITYHFCNFVADATHFPPLIPNGRYRLDLTTLYLNKEVAFMFLYCEIYTPIEYPKK